jgi:DNA-binding Lrp family transcriptional regulator
LFATVEKHELNSSLGKLKDVAYINWFGSTSGRSKLVATFKGNYMQKTDAEIRGIKSVVTTETMVPFEGQWEVPIGTSYRMRSSQQWHPWEILVTVRGQNYEEILAKTVHEISKINGVQDSETTFVYKPTVAA